jgi:hypothetical protein
MAAQAANQFVLHALQVADVSLKPFSQCMLPDFSHEISLATSAASASAFDETIVGNLLPIICTAQLSFQHVLLRHPLVCGCSGLVCSASVQNKQAWCKMLGDVFCSKRQV